MKTKLFTSLVTFFIISSAIAQTNLNNYKYVIVPNKYDFLNENNQYRLNELTQFLFDKYGFTAVMEGSEYPEDLILNRCLALRSDVLKDSGMFKTKLKIQLKNCNDKIVYTSKEGESREKEFKTAYNLALRDAFGSFEALNYKFEPSQGQISNSLTQPKEDVDGEVAKLKEELKTLKAQKAIEVTKAEPKAITNSPKANVNAVEQNTVPTTSKTVTKPTGMLYAQKITNGYQLVDSTPKVIYRIKNTGLDNVFLVEGKSALIYKKGDTYILEYYDNGTLKQQNLSLKF